MSFLKESTWKMMLINLKREPDTTSSHVFLPWLTPRSVLKWAILFVSGIAYKMNNWVMWLLLLVNDKTAKNTKHYNGARRIKVQITSWKKKSLWGRRRVVALKGTERWCPSGSRWCHVVQQPINTNSTSCAEVASHRWYKFKIKRHHGEVMQ